MCFLSPLWPPRTFISWDFLCLRNSSSYRFNVNRHSQSESFLQKSASKPFIHGKYLYLIFLFDYFFPWTAPDTPNNMQLFSYLFKSFPMYLTALLFIWCPTTYSLWQVQLTCIYWERNGSHVQSPEGLTGVYHNPVSRQFSSLSSLAFGPWAQIIFLPI